MKTILSLLFLLGLVPIAYADVQEIPYFDNRFLLTKNAIPTVCMHEPEKYNNGWETDVLYRITQNSVNDWQDALRPYGDFRINLIKIDNQTGFGTLTNEYRFCDVNINFMGAPQLNIQTGAFYGGGTYHHSSDRKWSDVLVYTWSYKVADPRQAAIINETIVANHYIVFSTPQQTLKDIVTHELGHAWGLKHHIWNGEFNSEFYHAGHAELSMMYSLTAFQVFWDKEITDIDVYAIVAKYGTDGWSGITNWKYDSLKIGR